MSSPELAARITAATEYLAGARRRKPSELPPSVMVREVAELRRQLGQVIDVISETSAASAVALNPHDVAATRQALSDAIRWRRARGTAADDETATGFAVLLARLSDPAAAVSFAGRIGGDPRVQAASRYLAEIEHADAGQLPPPDVARLRLHLRLVLDAIAGWPS